MKAVTGIKLNSAQLNHSFSEPGVVRAMRMERWDKLVSIPLLGRCLLQLQMLNRLSDIRKSGNFYFDPENQDESPQLLLIKKGLANSICVVGGKPVHCLYLVNACYDGRGTCAVSCNDPDLDIQ